MTVVLQRIFIYNIGLFLFVVKFLGQIVTLKVYFVNSKVVIHCISFSTRFSIKTINYMNGNNVFEFIVYIAASTECLVMVEWIKGSRSLARTFFTHRYPPYSTRRIYP